MCHFATSATPFKLPKMRHFAEKPAKKNRKIGQFREFSYAKWRFFDEVTIVLAKWRFFGEVTIFWRSDAFLAKWRIFGAEKAWPLWRSGWKGMTCRSDTSMTKWRVSRWISHSSEVQTLNHSDHYHFLSHSLIFVSFNIPSREKYFLWIYIIKVLDQFICHSKIWKHKRNVPISTEIILRAPSGVLQKFSNDFETEPIWLNYRIVDTKASK